MKHLTTRQLIIQAIIASIYFVLTVTLGGFSYLSIQFRYAEILNLLAFYNPIHMIGVTLGVFLSNLGSPLGFPDIVFGTLHTLVSLFFISRSKNLLISSFYPTIFSFIIGFMLSEIAAIPGGFVIITASVMLSEFIIMTLIAYPLFKYVLEKNKNFINTIKNTPL